MPHITEDTASRLTGRITTGTTLTRRYWSDDSTGHGAGFHTARTVKRSKDGWIIVTYDSYTSGRKASEELHFGPHDVVALVEMKPFGDTGALTYAHHDDRLTLPGGYMDARPGTNLRVWDVFLADGTPLAQEVTTAEGRALLAEHAPEMIWVHHGDGKWTARGHGQYWKIERGHPNPDYDPHASPLWQRWLYDLLARPLDADEWQKIKTDNESPQEARQAADEVTAP